MNITHFIFIFSLFLSFIANASSPSDLTATDPAQSIVVSKKNPTFKIILNSNPTTGSSWFIKSYDSQLITPLSTTFIPPTEAIPGRGGLAIWTFRVNKAAFHVPTITAIKLIYMLPWTAPTHLEHTFWVVIQAKNVNT